MLKPLLIDRCKILFDNVHVDGVVGASLNVSNPSFNAQHSSNSVFFRDKNGVDDPSMSITKICSVSDFADTIKEKVIDGDFFDIDIVSEQHDDTRVGISLGECFSSSFGVSVSNNDFVSLSFDVSSDAASPLLSSGNLPIISSDEEYLTSDNVTFECSNPNLEYVESFSLQASMNKVYLKGLIRNKKKTWSARKEINLSFQVDHIQKYVDQDPASFATTDFLIKFFSDESKTGVIGEFSLSGCALDSYSEQYSERGASATSFSYSYVEKDGENSIII